MDRSDFYFEQLVTQAEMDQAFDDVERMEQDQIVEYDLWGVQTGLAVTQTSTASLKVEVSAGAARDELGRRIELAVGEQVDLTSYVPATGGQEVKVHIYAQNYDEESDPRVDGYAVPLNYRLAEGCDLVVVSGTPAAPPAAAPSIVADQVLLAEVLIENGDTQLFDADITADWTTTPETRQEGGVSWLHGRLNTTTARMASGTPGTDLALEVGDRDIESVGKMTMTAGASSGLGIDMVDTPVTKASMVGTDEPDPDNDEGHVYVDPSTGSLQVITKWWPVDVSDMYPDANGNNDPRSYTGNNYWRLRDSAAAGGAPTQYPNLPAWEIDIDMPAGPYPKYTGGLIVPVKLPDGCRLVSAKVGVEVSATMGLATYLDLFICKRQGDTITVLSANPGTDWNKTSAGYYDDLAESVIGTGIIDNEDHTHFLVIQGKQTSADSIDVVRITGAFLETQIREASHVYEKP